MSASYIKAAIPEPHTILGRKLRPFCVGHYKILSRFDCAYVSEKSAQASREDLIFAVLVCSMRPKEFLEFIEQADFEKQLKGWGKKVGLFDLKEKSDAFQKYLDEHSKMPAVWFEQEASSSGAHWTQSVLLCLTSELGYTREEAEEIPLSQAFHDYLKHAEINGAVKFMTDEEIVATQNKEVQNGVAA